MPPSRKRPHAGAFKELAREFPSPKGDGMIAPTASSGFYGLAGCCSCGYNNEHGTCSHSLAQGHSQSAIRHDTRRPNGSRASLDGMPRYASCRETGTRPMAEARCVAKGHQGPVCHALPVRANGDTRFSGERGYGAAITKPRAVGNPLPLQGQGLLSADVARPGDASA